MNTPMFAYTPDYTPVIRMIEIQTRFAIETSQGLMKLALLPWSGAPKVYGVASDQTHPAVAKAAETQTETVKPVVEIKLVEPADPVIETVPVVAETVVAETVVAETVVAETVEVEMPAEPITQTVTEAAVAPVAKAAIAETPVVDAPLVAKVVEAAPVETAKVETPAVKTIEETGPEMIKPATMATPAAGGDDLTVLNGVGPKLAEGLNAAGIFSYAQIAAWTEANVAWIDENLPGVRGRASRNGWVAQAAALVE